MRPQHITAENGGARGGGGDEGLASMRPQHITAENSSGARGTKQGTMLQ